MRVLTIEAGTPGVRLSARPEPTLVRPDDVLLDVLQVGICGTDRNEAVAKRTKPPPGSTELVVGHEMIGRIVAVGPSATTLHPGDYAVLTVRRPCPGCPACAVDRSDMCYTGDYSERGSRARTGSRRSGSLIESVMRSRFRRSWRTRAR